MQGPCPAEGSPHRRPTWACSVGLTLWWPGRIGGHGSLVPSQKAEVSVVPALQEEGAAQMGLGRKQELRPPAQSSTTPFGFRAPSRTIKAASAFLATSLSAWPEVSSPLPGLALVKAGG